jgi:hypothetical protein
VKNLLTRRDFFSAAGAAALNRAAGQQGSDQPPWNVLFILIDDMDGRTSAASGSFIARRISTGWRVKHAFHQRLLGVSVCSPTGFDSDGKYARCVTDWNPGLVPPGMQARANG